MLLPRASIVLLLIFILLPVLSSARSEEGDPKKEPKEYEGMVQSAGDDKLALLVGDEEFTFEVGGETAIKFEGEDAALEDLKEGHFARVTAVKEGETLSAQIIDARAAQ